MTPERWQKAKKIFEAAMKRDRNSRAEFIAAQCDGDEEIRREVSSLIESHERTGTFIDAPAYQAAAKFFGDEKSELERGDVVGSYEILSFISRGGMGEVYLGHDRRLGRKIALKILPSSFTKNQERLRRFEQEARSASALNHPNIITIYEILKTESTHVIATEFVEGETLRQRLSDSRLELSEALNIAIQVADALAAAHKAGIVHRDIKPENIMIRQDGYVKVLDFGLAKLSEEVPSISADEAPTRQVRTGSGVIIGTAGYMSPEQARGKPVDARSDIFSLGSVIYEMVTRRKPFDGETASDVLASILKSEPPPISQVLEGTPPELARIVTKALKKNRDERYQVISDLLLDLKTLKQDLEFQARLQSAGSGIGVEKSSVATDSTSVAAAPTSDGATATMISQALSVELKRQRLRFGVFAAAALVILLGAAFGLYKLLNRPTRAHFQATTVTRVTNSGKVIDARLSHDGKYLVYSFSDAGNQSVWIRQVSTANDKVVVPPAPVGIFGITVSRDDHDLYYVIKRNFDAGTLYRLPLLGGTPVKLLERIDGAVTLSPDGKQLAFLRSSYPTENESALIVANVDGSSERALAVKKKPERLAPVFFSAPAWSPDGKLIAASVATAGVTTLFDGARSQVIAFPVNGAPEVNLTPDPWLFTGQVEWLPDMSGLIVIAGENGGPGAQVWFLSYPDGQKRRITNDLDQHRAIGMSGDGRMFVHIVGTGMVTIWLAPEGDASRATQLPVGNVGSFSALGNSLAWTADGRIVFASAEGSEINLWMTNADGTNRHALTSNSGINVSPVVSPDGHYIVFSSTRAGQANIWRMTIDGNNATQLTHGPADLNPVISPGGEWVVYSTLNSGRPTIWKVPMGGGESIQVVNRASSYPMISPNGKSLAFLYTESTDPLTPPNRIGIMPVDGGELIKTFNFEPATTVVTKVDWSNDGKAILYTTNTNNVTNIWAQPIDGGPPKQITDFKELYMTGFAWSRDGKQLAVSRSNYSRDAVIITDTNH